MSCYWVFDDKIGEDKEVHNNDGQRKNHQQVSTQLKADIPYLHSRGKHEHCLALECAGVSNSISTAFHYLFESMEPKT